MAVLAVHRVYSRERRPYACIIIRGLEGNHHRRRPPRRSKRLARHLHCSCSKDDDDDRTCALVAADRAVVG